MIVNVEREPDLSLYYLGGVLLGILEQEKVIPLEELLCEVRNRLKKKIHVDFMYYTLDWLFLLSLVRIKEGKVHRYRDGNNIQYIILHFWIQRRE